MGAENGSVFWHVQKQTFPDIFQKDVLKNFTIFTGKHQSWSLFFLQLYSKETPTVFSCKYFGVFKNSYLFLFIIEHLWWLLQYRVITLKQVQVASSAFLRCSFRKIFLNFWIIGRRTSTAESDLSRIAPAALLLSLFVMDNFFEILQEFKENSFQYKK